MHTPAGRGEVARTRAYMHGGKCDYSPAALPYFRGTQPDGASVISSPFIEVELTSGKVRTLRQVTAVFDPGCVKTRYHAAKTHSSPSCPRALPVAAMALVSVVTNAAQSRLAIIAAAQKRSDGIAQYRDQMRSAGKSVIGERAPPRRRLTNTPHFKLERRRFFSIFWTPTVQTVPMDNGYEHGVSIELERFTAAALQLDDRGARSSLPQSGDAEY